MATPIVMPEAGESVASGVLAAWLKEDGAWVERDEAVAEVETDKITVEILAPASGVLRRSVNEGDEIEVNSAVGEVDESAQKPAGAASNGAASAEAGGSSTATAAPPKTETSSPSGGSAAAASAPEPSKPASAPASTSAPAANGSVNATPLARKLAAEHGVDLSRISGTGPSGRIREQDVLASVQTAGSGQAVATEPKAEPKAERSITTERMSPMRQRIASRLVEAQQTAAMLTTFNEVDMGAVMALRKKYKEPFADKHGIGLGFMSFFVKACCAALQAFPRVNSYITADRDGKPAIRGHDYCDVAIAVSSPKGLVVPVIRSAEQLSFAGIESAIKDFATRAKDGKLSVEEMQDGTFTITNGGIFGSLMSTPILNPPQSAILGMHSIKNRPMEWPVGSGEVKVRPMMYLALSYDHRIVDGSEAVRFLVHIKDAIEDPQRLMLDL